MTNDQPKPSRLDKLKQQSERLKSRIKREEKRISGQNRKAETRRKILDGALIRAYAANNPEIQKLLDRLRHEKLTRPDERELFGLEPIAQNENQKTEREEKEMPR